MPRPTKLRYIVKVTDWSQQEAYLGAFTNHDRAREYAAKINDGIEKRVGGNMGAAWASVVDLDPPSGVKALVDWALGYPDDEQEEWERRANAEIGGVS